MRNEIRNETTKKLVAKQEEWDQVKKELETEVPHYGERLFGLLGDVRNKKILDYGAGPGVTSLVLKKLGATVRVYDINPEMRKTAGEKVGNESIYHSKEDIPKDYFDIIVVSMVLCIVDETEVYKITSQVKNSLNSGGFAMINFCNPKIFHIPESSVDVRFPTGAAYEENHDYKKIKKDGQYEIIESHRPIEWYEKVFTEAGLKLTGTFFTSEYELNGKKIVNYIYFKLRKE